MELTTAAAKKIAEKATEQALKYTIEKVKDATRPKTDNPVVPICERLSSEIKAGLLSDAALEARMEGAAHSECKFFELPESELVKRDSITDCMKRCDLLMADDKTLFSLDQFKDMNSLSFEDMSKVWSHECGHRVLQVYEMSPRVQELGADFFMGVRSEMLGLPNGNLEKALGESKGGNSHSPGHLRLQAIQYGRETVQDFKKAGVPITMQNLREAFRMSRFAKIGEHEVADTKVAALANDKAWHYKEVAKAQDNANYYSHEAKKAADKGDFMRAKDLQSKVDFYENKTNEEKRIADAFSIPVEKTDYEMAEKSQPQLAEFSENIKGNPYGNLYKDITVESYKQGEEALKMLSEEDPQLYAHVREMMNEGEPFSNQDYFLNYFECAKGENGELLFFNSAPEAVNSAILVKENTIKAISGCPVLKEGCGAPNFLIDRALPNKHYIVDNMEFQTDASSG